MKTILAAFASLWMAASAIPWNACMAATGATEGVPAILPSSRDSTTVRWNDTQVTIGYWNDNFITESLLGSKVGQGSDDYVTASFWFQFGVRTSRRWWFADLFHNVLTNRRDGYRTDLLTGRVSMESMTRFGLCQCGIGLIASGDFGGDRIQNSYHRVTGARRIDLDYVSGETGVLFFTRIEPLLWRSGMFDVKGFAANSYRTGVGPSNYRSGVEIVSNPFRIMDGRIMHIQGRAGYIQYYRRERYLAPLFNRGLNWGALVSLGRMKRWSYAFWVSGSQYGRNRPQFGVSWTFGWNGSRMCDLSDITYP